MCFNAQIATDLRSLSGEVKTEFAKLRGDIITSSAVTDAKISTMSAVTDAKFAAVDLKLADMADQISKIDAKLDKLLDRDESARNRK